MGCDIHLFMEYREKRDGASWRSFGKKINPGRVYGLFAFLAGVRSYGDEKPVVPPRGIPTDLGFWASDAWWFYLVDRDDDDEEGYAERSRGMSWVVSGSSVPRTNAEGKVTHVSDPDAHTPGWCTPDEFQAVLDAIEKKWPGQFNEPEYTACMAAMRHFESLGYEARFVFWFDN